VDGNYSKCPFRSPEAISEAIQDIIKDKVVCELGCAEGDNMVFMSRYAKKVIGVDNNQTRLNKAIERGFDVVNGNYYHVLPKADVYYFWADKGTIDNEPLTERIYSTPDFEGYIIVAGDIGFQTEPPAVKKCAERWNGELREVKFCEGSGVRESGTFILAIIKKDKK